jgi:hypothetical protein
MNLFINGFWDGFIDKTNPVHSEFYVKLLETVFGCSMTICYRMEDCDILLESIFGPSVLGHKEWKYSFLYSGESRIFLNYKDYSCVLWGERNHNNVVNLPQFIPYVYCNSVSFMKELSIVPKKNICAILTNSGGGERNTFMDKLEKLIPIDYAGTYKTNVDVIRDPYYTEGFRKFVSQYKFIITMENSRLDTYITEKIIHGFASGTIPIYWGSQRVTDYFNGCRFINVDSVDDATVSEVADKIRFLCEHPEEYLNIVQQPVFSNERTISDIARDIRNVIFPKPINDLSQIYIVSNPEFEPERCSRLRDLFLNQLGFSSDCVSFISPTYKHTITDDIMRKYVKSSMIHKLRNNPMKLAEISLFLNYKTILGCIEKNYKDGLFLIFESDVLLGKDFDKFNSFMNEIKDKMWQVIHIGMYDNRIWGSPNFKTPTGYDERIFYNNDLAIEDITSEKDQFRLSRKFYTRCCDSFLWKYTGVVNFLNFINTNDDYSVPFDYYMCNFFEKNTNTKHYWSEDEFFKQGSNIGIFQTTIQS